jgi:hypothetical protein
MISSLFGAIATVPHDYAEVEGQSVHLRSCRRCAIPRRALDAHEQVLNMIRIVNELFGEVEELWR